MPIEIVGLSPQLKRTLELRIQGFSAKAIGKILKLEPSTVAAYMRTLRNKLGATNMNQAIANGFEKGYLKVIPCLLMAILISISTSGINQPSRSPRRPVQRPAAYSRLVREYSA